MKNAILIDTTGFSPDVQAGWEETGFLEKLRHFGQIQVIWDPNDDFKASGLPRYRVQSSLVDTLLKEGVERVINVYPDQCFLDLAIVQEGLAKADKVQPDYFTQWEHCRLPKGIGIRAISLSALSRTETASPQEALYLIIQNPTIYLTLYDDESYVDYDASLLDACIPSSVLEETRANIASFDLEGFLQLAKTGPGALPSVAPGQPPVMDERGLPAAYGFESADCSDFPTYVMFDITNRCNAKCIHCPQSTLYADNKHASGFLDLNIYKKVIDECRGKSIQFVRLTADGEPFVHPRLFDMIEYAREAGVGPVGLTTNGSLMFPKKAERLAESGLFVVDVSLDALSQDTFEKIRVGLSYEKTISNTEHLIAYRNRIGSPLKIMVSFVVQDGNRHELEDFVRYWEPRVDKVLVRELHTNVGTTVSVEQLKAKQADRWPCPHWFRRVVINFDGQLKACPIDWKNESVYKSLNDTSIHAAWHSRFYWENRMQHLNNQISDSSLCKNCGDWRETPWDMGYEKVVHGLTIQREG